MRRAGLDSVRLDRLATALQTAGDIAFRVTAPGAAETLAAAPLRAQAGEVVEELHAW
ncbi:hypothetical protein [Microbispora sp. NPDC046933]|uniref:hypothetical protein n=1 Tax=Microbispora sp. NPDC046933 TaxID=3155618 RepID=UPI0033F59D56